MPTTVATTTTTAPDPALAPPCNVGEVKVNRESKEYFEPGDPRYGTVPPPLVICLPSVVGGPVGGLHARASCLALSHSAPDSADRRAVTWPAPRRPDADAPPRPLSAGSWAGLLVAAGVALGLLVSGTTALSWYRHDVRALDSERQSEVDALVDGVRVRLEDIGEFVQGEAAAYRGATLPTQNELNDEFALPDVLGREPGVIGEFYVEKVMSGELLGLRREAAGRGVSELRRAAVRPA